MKRKNILGLVTGGLLTFLTYYYGLPNIGLRFLGMWLLFGMILIIPSLIAFTVRKTKSSDYWESDRQTSFSSHPITLFALGAGIVSIAVGLLGLLFSWIGLFGSVKAYTSLIGPYVKQEEKVLSSDLAPLDPTNMRVVDDQYALKLAQGKMTQNMGSYAQLGGATTQKINAGLQVIIPILHRESYWTVGNTKRNTTGTVGYMRVAVNNEEDVEYVTKNRKGETIYNRYQPNAYFKYNLERHIKHSGYWTAGLTDYSYEVDDNGDTWWVVTTYKNTIGIGRMPDVTGVLVVNPATGKITPYTLGEIPEWIDRVYPMEFIEKQLNYYGKYLNGSYYWADKSNTFETSHDKGGMVYGRDSHCYYYYGLTSTNGNDSVTIGFMLVNTRTKEATRYVVAGYVESECLQSLEGAIVKEGLTATHPPTLEGVNGVITHFATLKDPNGRVKKYGFVSVEDPNKFGIGLDVQEALNNYTARLGSIANAIAPDDNTSSMKLQGVITEIVSQVVGGNTQYYFTVKNSDFVFYGTPTLAGYQLAFTKAGDSVAIAFTKPNGSSQASLSSFTNKRVNMQRNKVTKDLLEATNLIRTKQKLERSSQNLDAMIEELKPFDSDSLSKGGKNR